MTLETSYGKPEVHTQAELEATAAKYLKENKPKMSAKELKELATLKANAARRYAENLIASGEPDTLAWNRAIRLEILESNSD